MNMKRIVAALASVLFSFFIAQAALATDHIPQSVGCFISKCSEGFSLDTENCRCVSDGKPNPICRAVIRCGPGSDLDPETCRCIKDKDLFEKADTSEPSKPSSGDPTTAKPEKPVKEWPIMPLPKNPDPKPMPKMPCPANSICFP